MHNIGSLSTFLFKKINQFFSILECVNPFWFHLFYFIVVSLIGFLVLRTTDTRYSVSSRPDDLDIFLSSVSASTLSSMTFVEMEVFSTSQLVVMTVLMFVGGEVFVSMLSLILRSMRELALGKLGDENTRMSMTPYSTSSHHQINQLEHGNIHAAQFLKYKMKFRAINTLWRVVFGYIIVIHSLGILLVMLYVILTTSARDTLKTKGLNLPTFSIFLIVSTFANCGFVPTNENMIAFRKNPGLLLILFPQILLGNTLFPCFLRLVIRVLEKIYKGEEYKYILNNYHKLGFSHLFSTFNTCMLGATALGFVVLQFVVFSAMDWSNIGLEGLSSYEKVIGSWFQATNARHSGESILDLSSVSTSVIVLFVVMMYLPPYTMFIPTWKKDQEKGLTKEDDISTTSTKLQRKSFFVDSMNMILSPLSTLFIFTFLICITERKNLRDDPLNFNILNIVVEVISSYGNVGYSMGYSCGRRLNRDESCKDIWIGFSGRWSKEGKVVLIVVMLYGRLKNFFLQGGQGWHLM